MTSRETLTCIEMSCGDWGEGRAGQSGPGSVVITPLCSARSSAWTESGGGGGNYNNRINQFTISPPTRGGQLANMWSRHGDDKMSCSGSNVNYESSHFDLYIDTVEQDQVSVV